jgi:hypothetical protein
MPAKGWRKPEHLRKTQPRKQPAPVVEEPAEPAGVTEEEMLFQEHFELTYWSLTLAVRGGHIPDNWFERAQCWLNEYCEEGAVAVEAGGRAKHLHVQGILGMHAKTDKESHARLVRFFREYVPIARGSKGTVQCKPIQRTQTFDLMLGYVQKDEGRPHYKVHFKNVDEARAAAARKAHQSVRIDPTAGRRLLNKSNIYKEMYAFHFLYLRPLVCSAERTLQLMLSTDEYIPTANWLVSHGSGMKRSRAEAYWRVLHNPKDVSLEDVGQIFFDQDRWGRYTDRHEHQPASDCEDDMNFDEMRDRAQALRSQFEREEQEVVARHQATLARSQSDDTASTDEEEVPQSAQKRRRKSTNPFIDDEADEDSE